MRFTKLVVTTTAVAVLATATGYAQGSGNRGRQGRPDGAQARQDPGPRGGGAAPSERRAQPRDDGQRPDGRPRGDDRQRADGRQRRDDGRDRVAVQRGNREPRGGGRTVVIRPRVTARYFSVAPRYNYAYRYGALGWGYYDPFWYGADPRYGYYYGGSGYSDYNAYSYDFGRLRLDVEPREAQVFIDGDYVGRVDDFDGRLQGLTLETGGYSIEVVAPGFEPLTFDVRITPGRTTTYRGELLPQRP